MQIDQVAQARAETEMIGTGTAMDDYLNAIKGGKKGGGKACYNCGEKCHFQRECPCLKGKGGFKGWSGDKGKGKGV